MAAMPTTLIPDNDPSLPSVGIFWGVPDGAPSNRVLVIDATPLNHAEPYGAALTHARGHYDVWEAWQALGPAGLKRRGLPAAIAWSEYETHPRGRIVYDTATCVFTIYADRRIQVPDFIQRIVSAFGLTEAQFVVRGDSHYRS
ncbi:hypothetical protein [Methylobacterium sp. WL116]|uniref:hypothetical protein n=1 Tax=Methylobacterium sp. WL116 TaxID=2603889 RepID=UPI0011C8067B|nr:hypothetical protein [Methylobacterium sp. WL116]TXM95362.1 hypothetical protein FV223_01005 [Methylobacterium sp. WL116]